MQEADIRNWGTVAASTADPRQAWQQVQNKFSDLGLGNAYFVFDYPLFSSGFPAEDQLLGEVVCEEWKDSCRDGTGGDIGWSKSSRLHVPLAASVGRRVRYDLAKIIKSGFATRKQIETLSIALDYGAKVGYMYPVVDRFRKTFSLVMIDGVDSAKDYVTLMEHHGNAIWRGAIYFHEGMTMRGLIVSAGRNPLSPRERDCLAWTAAGRSVKQIADTLNLAHSTVNEYIRSACTKLGATNKTQAAARAMLLEFFTP